MKRSTCWAFTVTHGDEPRGSARRNSYIPASCCPLQPGVVQRPVTHHHSKVTCLDHFAHLPYDQCRREATDRYLPCDMTMSHEALQATEARCLNRCCPHSHGLFSGIWLTITTRSPVSTALLRKHMTTAGGKQLRGICRAT